MLLDSVVDGPDYMEGLYVLPNFTGLRTLTSFAAGFQPSMIPKSHCLAFLIHASLPALIYARWPIPTLPT